MKQTCDSHQKNTEVSGGAGPIERSKSAAAGFIWAAGLLLAGSEGPLMPWVNLLGILMFAGITPVLGSWFSCPEALDSSSRPAGKQPGGQPPVRPVRCRLPGTLDGPVSAAGR